MDDRLRDSAAATAGRASTAGSQPDADRGAELMTSARDEQPFLRNLFSDSAMAPIAPIHPTLWISFCSRGANTNWPKEPPALMKPEAAPRVSHGRRWVAAPISTEKLAPPEPAEASRPRVIAKPKRLSMNGVTAHPTARSTTCMRTPTRRQTLLQSQQLNPLRKKRKSLNLRFRRVIMLLNNRLQ